MAVVLVGRRGHRGFHHAVLPGRLCRALAAAHTLNRRRRSVHRRLTGIPTTAAAHLPASQVIGSSSAGLQSIGDGERLFSFGTRPHRLPRAGSRDQNGGRQKGGQCPSCEQCRRSGSVRFIAAGGDNTRRQLFAERPQTFERGLGNRRSRAPKRLLDAVVRVGRHPAGATVLAMPGDQVGAPCVDLAVQVPVENVGHLHATESSPPPRPLHRPLLRCR